MGNLMSGHELISKVCKKPVYGKWLWLFKYLLGQWSKKKFFTGLTVPLVTTEIGDKFGKSAGNAVWLAPEKTSAFTFYQFWMRQPDSEVEKFLKLFTFDKVGSISDLMRQHRQKPELRMPQKRLAEQVTLLVHGEEGLQKAQEATLALYEGSITALGQMNTEDIAQLFSGATTVSLLPEAGQDVLDLAMKARCFATKGKLQYNIIS